MAIDRGPAPESDGGLAAALAQVREMVLDPDGLVRASAGGRRRGHEPPPWQRVTLRWVDLRAGRCLQVVGLDGRQAHTRNLGPGQAPAALDELLAQAYSHWHVETADATLSVRVTGKGRVLVTERKRAEAVAGQVADRAHDRSKLRLLDPRDPVLRAVGISDGEGRVIPRRAGKYRQVEEFLRLLEPVLDDARPASGRPLRVADLGCGNAYLTFAAYRWLAGRGADPELVGVDLRSEARRRNTELAAALGWAHRVSFVEGSIAAATLDPPPDLVLALHACDTATDEALAQAVRWRAAVVLAAPCCHHDLQRQLRETRAPPPYGPLWRHGILRERFADVLTDALRAAILRLLGYRVDVVEFVESAHTPRNVLIRAVRTRAEPDPTQVREYAALTASWQVTPALHRLLRADVEAVVAAGGTDPGWAADHAQPSGR